MTHSDALVRSLLAETRSLLSTRRIGRVIRMRDVVTSTNLVASKWGDEGAPDGAVVYAEYQTAGRGRLGRTWTALSGLNLTFSVVLRPSLAPERWGMISIAACLAVAETVDEFASPHRAEIKWPNDVRLNGRKCCGMLLESNWSPSRQGGSPVVVLGIGINVNQEDFPSDLENTATSLLLEVGRPVMRSMLFAAILNRLERRLDEVDVDADSLRSRYLGRMTDLGQHVRLRFTDDRDGIDGKIVGIDPAGGLILDTADGRRTFHAGEVTRSV